MQCHGDDYCNGRADKKSMIRAGRLVVCCVVFERVALRCVALCWTVLRWVSIASCNLTFITFGSIVMIIVSLRRRLMRCDRWVSDARRLA
jgi:hypothetical protein